jgi:hypothetical protein
MSRKGRKEALDGLDDEIRDHLERETEISFVAWVAACLMTLWAARAIPRLMRRLRLPSRDSISVPTGVW